ncbi:hypothetical protein [Actinoplanes aureus]|uniref:Uncharacterized protein n=1 Tax=Actinoplanes aureus TaxID=2792083 RepID=A0A931CG97_9ACTN|nr:hypothetical protein [Actinoplanes aureus]MBG0568084.1 hypothetical protein [Actinoplanes aureus]
MTTISGRRWAYIGAALGGTVSIAANVAHSFIPPKEVANPADWTPEAGAVVGAVVWPVFLFVAVEIFARVAWPTRLHWQLIRWVGLLPVAFVAALVSYRHLSGLLAFYGDETIVYIIGPLAVDGLMIGATGAILATSQPRHTTSVSAPAVPGTTGVPAPTLPAVPAPNIAPRPADNPTPSPDPAPTPEPVTAARADAVPTPADVATRVTASPTTIPLRPTAARPATAGSSKPRPRKTASTASAEPLAAPAADISVTEPEPAQLPLPMAVDPALLVKARQIAEQYRTETGSPIKAGQLAARLRVNSEVAAQALAVLDLDPHHPTDEIPTVNGTPVKATR